MKMSIPLIIFFTLTLLGSHCHAQAKEYLGVIKLNDSSFIPYKLVFEIKGDSISGYSLTDFAGEHETKSNIRGTYDSKIKELRFREYDIVYTKSPITQTDFCLVHYKGKLRKPETNKAFSGDFQGFYMDGENCINGAVIMTNVSAIQDRMARVDKRIQKSKKLSREVKEKISARRILDTLTRNIISSGENMIIFSRDNKVDLILYDAGKIDQDRVDLVVDGQLLLEDFEVGAAPKVISIVLEKPRTTIQVIARNEGTNPPNTVKVEVRDNTNYVQTITNLKKGESAAMTLIKQ